MKTLRHFACVLIFSVATLNVNAQVDPNIAATLQNSIDSLLNAYQVKGISAAAYIPGQGIWYGSSGVSYGTTPIDSNMLLGIGSITKTFVAAEILKMVELGMLSLDDSLYQVTGPHPNFDSTITVRQMLMHRSGVGDYTNSAMFSAMFADPYQVWYFPVARDSFTTAPIFAPGTAYSYCNANYNLLGQIIEEQLGDSVHNVLRNSLLAPLNLGNTYMEVFEPYPNAIAHNWASPNYNPPTAVDCVSTPHEALWSSAEPAGGYFSNPIDLVTWGHALYSGQVLSPASLTEMTTFSGVTSSYYTGYGLGCQRFPYMNRIYWGHGGNFYGYAGSMMYYPQDSICVALLINTDVNVTVIARVVMHQLVNALHVGMDEPAPALTFECYPNPASENLTVQCPFSNDAVSTITLTDLAGREIHAETFYGPTAEISTAEYPAGVYLVTVECGERSSTQRLMIAH